MRIELSAVRIKRYAFLACHHTNAALSEMFRNSSSASSRRMPAAAANACCVLQGILSNDASTSPSSISCGAGARVSRPSKVFTCRKLREFRPAGCGAADIRDRCSSRNLPCVAASVGIHAESQWGY